MHAGHDSGERGGDGLRQHVLDLDAAAGVLPLPTHADEPVVNAITPGLRGQLDLPLRVALALLAGLGLALLAHYIDPTVRDRAELERVGLPVLGEIPKERG